MGDFPASIYHRKLKRLLMLSTMYQSSQRPKWANLAQTGTNGYETFGKSPVNVISAGFEKFPVFAYISGSEPIWTYSLVLSTWGMRRLKTKSNFSVCALFLYNTNGPLSCNGYDALEE